MRTLLPGDNPQAYIPEDRRRALAHGVDLPLRSSGAALFVDISGFTPLTEALARAYGARRGAEELSATLDRLTAALIETLQRRRASVVYFSGDAVTAWIEGDDGNQATACAFEMQDVVSKVGEVTTPDGGSVVLGVKVAVAVGEVHRFLVGVPRVQLIDVLAGRLMDSLAAAEQQARSGEVVLDAGALESLAGRVVVRETRAGEAGPVGVVDSLDDAPPCPDPEPWPRLPEDVARQWLLPPVWERMVAGRGEFLADLRPAVPVFVRFGGLDFENDPEAPRILDDFVRRSQYVFDERGGSILQLTIGDKGAYLYGVFGAPIAHEDDAGRACDAALRLREIAGEVPVTDVQIGVATGRLRSGTYGHQERKTFCCLGDATNLAARLMGRAPAQGIWVHGDVAARAGDRFEWTELPPVQVKGREQPVSVQSLDGHALRRAARDSGPAGAMLGRQTELARLRELWALAENGHGQVVVIQAEAGTGKSRLVRELTDGLQTRGVRLVTGEATPATQAAYAAWRSVWHDLLGLSADADAASVDRAVDRLDPELLPRAPLLGPVLGLAIPDSDLTASFSGELRKTSLEDLLTRLLAAIAERAPLVVVLEEAMWLDQLSRDLLEEIARAVRTLPVLCVALLRPDGTAFGGLPLRAVPHVTDLPLGSLDPDSSRSLAIARHVDLVGREPDEALVDTVVTRAEGNPFYLEQLVEYLVAHAADQGPTADLVELPESLHSLVLSRIDAQSEGSRRAVKVASVIGRAFQTPLVATAYPELGIEDSVHTDLLDAAASRLVALEDERHRSFVFGHPVTRDVAYDSLPFSVKTVLHGRVGDVLEAEPDAATRYLDVLAYHFSRSDDLVKKRHYLREAAAAARAAYAQMTAIAYLQELLPIVEPEERAEVQLQLGEALVISGDWAAAEAAVASARADAETVGDVTGVARARVARAELDRKQGRYAEAEDELAEAEAAFVELDDAAGRGQVLHLRGTLQSQQGHPERAREAYEASLALRRELGDEAGIAAMLTNLALVAEDEGDLLKAEVLGLEGLDRRRALDDRRAVSVCLTNLGMLATSSGDLALARERFLEAQTLAELVGDPWMVAVGRHNLGNVSRDLGDLAVAAADFEPALAAYVERDDLWSVAHLLEDVAVLGLALGGVADGDAMYLLAAAARLREQIGAPRFPPTEEALAQAVAPAADRTAAETMADAEAAGTAADLAAAIDIAGVVLSAARDAGPTAG